LSNFISAFNRNKEAVGAIRDELSVHDQKGNFVSHYHYDHILGFLMFKPLFKDKYNINIYFNINLNYELFYYL
ncbi:MAG: hypothetical protein COB17_08620, partial [Sulfurimonas sp.]